MRRRVLHPALRHGDLPDMYLDEHRRGAVLAQQRLRPRGVVEGGPEIRRNAARDAEAEFHDAPRQTVDGRRVREPLDLGQMRPHQPRAEVLPAIQAEHAAHHAMLRRRLQRDPARVVFEAADERGQGTVSLLRLFHPPRHDQSQAAHQPEPRPRGDDLLAQQTLRGLELDQPFPGEQATAASPLHDVARECRLSRLDGVTHGGSRLAPSRESAGDSPMDGPKPLRRLPEAASDAMFPDQRVQPPHVRCAVADRLEHSHQDGHRIDPAHRIPALQDVVQERRVHPVEQPDIEQEFPVLRPEPGEQPRFHPVLNEFLRSPRGTAPAARLFVAGNPERERPTGRVGHQRRQPLPRELPVEERRDLRAGEPQVVRRQDRAAALQHGAGHVHAVGQLTTGECEMQVGRGAVQQKLQQRRRIGVPEPFQLVEHQHERVFEIGDLAQRDLAAAFRPALHRAQIPRREALQPGDGARRGGLAGIGDVGVENRGLVLLVHGNPGGADPVVAQPAAAFRKQDGLAEPGGRLQHRETPAGRHGALDQLRAFQIAGHPVGHRDLLAQQPGQRPPVAGVSARTGGRFPRVAVSRVPLVSAHRPCRAGDGTPRPSGALARTVATARGSGGPAPRNVGLLRIDLQ